METLSVALDDRSYPIHIGAGVLDAEDLWQPHLRAPKAVVVSNEKVAPLYFERLRLMLSRLGIEAIPVFLPDGEAHKNWQTLNTIFTALLEQRCERSTPLIALGGGVVGDMGGFAAACYQRGMPFIQVPTTLLAQVDSSVGGKTAINHPLGKNMIGAFYQPKVVFADTSLLNTLPPRELRAGLSEVIKYGLIRDLPFLEWLEAHLEALLRLEPEALGYAVSRSCTNKAEVVVNDERETGERALLNLGHTFGHAIETGMGYGAWLHGEAVAAGTMMAADLSLRLGWLKPSEVARIEVLFGRAGLPIRGANIAAERYLELMRHDKKVQDGRMRLVLLRSIGLAVLSDVATDEQILATIGGRCE